MQSVAYRVFTLFYIALDMLGLFSISPLPGGLLSTIWNSNAAWNLILLPNFALLIYIGWRNVDSLAKKERLLHLSIIQANPRLISICLLFIWPMLLTFPAAAIMYLVDPKTMLMLMLFFPFFLLRTPILLLVEYLVLKGGRGDSKPDSLSEA